MKKLFEKGKNLVLSPQTSVLSAATIIMVMVVASRVLGLVRQRVLAHFFTPSELSLFFAAFRLPDLIFEVLVFGTFASAFIPVFTRVIKKSQKEAWAVASRVVNIGLITFAIFAFGFGFFAHTLYSLVAPGFSYEETEKIAQIARLLFAAQGFFVISYVLTGVLESLRHFLVPALAPLFYNIGIILGTIFLYPVYGDLAPAVGVVIGALAHFLVQLPMAYKLGFRFKASLKLDKNVRKIGRLAAPRILDLSIQQVGKTVELGLASLISTASYTFFTFANTLQLLPVGLFGISLSKAALPTLAHQEDDPAAFKRTLLSTFYQIMFMILPTVAILIVLRVPIVRLVYGTDIFDWQATVETGMVLTAYAVGIPFQSAVSLLSRAFYALHDTKTPVIISVISTILVVAGDFILIKGLSFPVWGLAASYSFGVFVQSIILYTILLKRIDGVKFVSTLTPLLKSVVATVASGGVMFFVLKLFDRSVWVKRLSFFGRLDIPQNLPFERFVLDTRYTGNLLILTTFVMLVGAAVYLFLSLVFGTRELFALVRIIKRKKIKPLPEEQETVTPPTSESVD